MALAGGIQAIPVDVINGFFADGNSVKKNSDILDGKVFNTFSAITRANVIVVGSGGTGGYVVRDLARLLQSRSSDGSYQLTIIDPDKVEEKNLIRQNFIMSDLGRYKAEVLAERYSGAFGLEINVITQYCNQTLLRDILRKSPRDPLLIIGCVDNNEARRGIHKFIVENFRYSSSNLIAWIDAGNESSAGQVVMGALAPGASKYTLPFVTQVYPEILDPNQDSKEEISCAERAQRDIQNIFVNLTAATNILNFVNMIFSGKKSSIYGVEFGITGVTKPMYLQKAYTISSRIPKEDSLWQ